MNISTPEGMESAKRWMQGFISALYGERTPWAIPRSGTIYELDKKNQTAWHVHGPGDPDTVRVFEAIGWRVASENERN